MGPGPSVEAAVPAPTNVFANLARQANVVGNDPVVRCGARRPRFGVLDYPVAVAAVARKNRGIGDKARRAHVSSDITPSHSLLHGIPHASREGRVLKVVVVGDPRYSYTWVPDHR